MVPITSNLTSVRPVEEVISLSSFDSIEISPKSFRADLWDSVICHSEVSP
ncbi:hypothetical protein [Zooshikella harenae]|uniref:Uncharacterized protein n=1 Tax=Zooshikella harenae TaxID=2827238 RepID=A0ABS5ZJ58_9GAMM|nr:hypothetical protein [Zooshikella harenae]MBU2714062.1 hypothetical protein [Zooshikella harenae]